MNLVRGYPQTAYIPGRCTSTALRQVFEHCHQVRDQAQGDQLTIHQRAAGQQPSQCTGGLQISMDLSAAFDLGRWEHVKDAMDLAGVPLGVQDLLLVWLVQVRYVFNHRGRSGTILLSLDGDSDKDVSPRPYFGPPSPRCCVPLWSTNSGTPGHKITSRYTRTILT